MSHKVVRADEAERENRVSGDKTAGPTCEGTGQRCGLCRAAAQRSGTIERVECRSN